MQLRYKGDGSSILSAAVQKGTQGDQHQLLTRRLTGWLQQLLFIWFFIQYTGTVWLITPFL